MAAEETGAVTVPASVTVRGNEIEIDASAMQSWAVFNHLRTLEKDEDAFAKADAAFAIVELISGLTSDDIVELCGGPDADVRDVIGFALEVIQAATPKN